MIQERWSEVEHYLVQTKVRTVDVRNHFAGTVADVSSISTQNTVYLPSMLHPSVALPAYRSFALID